ncbi:ATP dependent DNA ligase [Streptacidiphilus sp. PAMC 29251]
MARGEDPCGDRDGTRERGDGRLKAQRDPELGPILADHRVLPGVPSYVQATHLPRTRLDSTADQQTSRLWALAALLERLAAPVSPLTSGPAPDRRQPVRWVKPLVRGEVEYLEYTENSHLLRHPVWKGLRGSLGE